MKCDSTLCISQLSIWTTHHETLQSATSSRLSCARQAQCVIRHCQSIADPAFSCTADWPIGERGGCSPSLFQDAVTKVFCRLQLWGRRRHWDTHLERDCPPQVGCMLGFTYCYLQCGWEHWCWLRIEQNENMLWAVTYYSTHSGAHQSLNPVNIFTLFLLDFL